MKKRNTKKKTAKTASRKQSAADAEALATKRRLVAMSLAQSAADADKLLSVVELAALEIVTGQMPPTRSPAEAEKRLDEWDSVLAQLLTMAEEVLMAYAPEPIRSRLREVFDDVHDDSELAAGEPH